MSILDDIGSHLVSSGVVGGSTDWALFKSYQPDYPDKTITIFDLGGDEPDQTDGVEYEFPEFKVQVRGESFGYSAARDKMVDVVNALNNATVSGYIFIYPLNSGVVPEEYDKADNRPEISVEFKAMKEP